MDFLDRGSAPISDAYWQQLDESVITSARSVLVGRRLIAILGPVGPGTYTIPYSQFGETKGPAMDLTGNEQEFVVEARGRVSVTLPILYQDFRVNWRDLEMDSQMGIPFDTSAAAMAATLLAQQEDRLIFNGNGNLGLQGLLSAEGRNTVSLRSWEEPGSALADAVQAVGALAASGHPGPYAMAVSPALYGKMVRAYANTGMLELDQIKALLRGAVIPTSAIDGNKGVIIANGSHNVQLAVGQDMTTAYLGPIAMNQMFRVLETVALIVRRSDAICTLE